MVDIKWEVADGSRHKPPVGRMGFKRSEGCWEMVGVTWWLVKPISRCAIPCHPALSKRLLGDALSRISTFPTVIYLQDVTPAFYLFKITLHASSPPTFSVTYRYRSHPVFFERDFLYVAIDSLCSCFINLEFVFIHELDWCRTSAVYMRSLFACRSSYGKNMSIYNIYYMYICVVCACRNGCRTFHTAIHLCE